MICLLHFFDRRKRMPQLLMRENSPMPEYHGEFDCLIGEKSPELNIDIALKLARRFPEVFEPIGFAVEDFKEDTPAVTKENLMNIRFIFNPLFEEYHSASGIDFDEVGEEKALTFSDAKQLLERFPSAFELVDSTFQNKNAEAEVEVEADNSILAEDILTLLKTKHVAFEELKEHFNEHADYKQLRSLIMILSKKDSIKKDEDGKWMLT